jgi:hypothetical protein
VTTIRAIKKGGEAFTPALGTPEEVSYFFFLLAFLAVDAFFFLAMFLASSLSGGRAEGTGAVLAKRKSEMLHDFSAFRSPSSVSSSHLSSGQERPKSPSLEASNDNYKSSEYELGILDVA